MSKNIVITRYGEYGFNSAFDNLVETTLSNPVYASHFSMYYSTVQKNSEENKSFIISVEDEPTIGLAYSVNTEKDFSAQKLTYFGLPSLFMLSTLQNKQKALASLPLFITELTNNQIRVKQGRVESNFVVQIKPNNLEFRPLEKLFLENGLIEPILNRVINLSQGLHTVRDQYSKSAKIASRDGTLSTSVYGKNHARNVTDAAIETLKKLHFESAGQLTRPNLSWDIQSELVASGRAFVVLGEHEGSYVSAALFMTNQNSAYYAVSASRYSSKISGLSHQIIDSAIEYLTTNDYKYLWLGPQYQSSFRELSEKEVGIEKFKGFFGGHIVIDFICKNEFSEW